MSDSPLVERLAVIPDPADAAECFADLPHLLLFDSTADGERTGRYSFLAADPSAVVRSRGQRSERLEQPGGGWTAISGDALTEVRRTLEPFRMEPVPGLPPFQGRGRLHRVRLGGDTRASAKPPLRRPGPAGCDPRTLRLGRSNNQPNQVTT